MSSSNSSCYYNDGRVAKDDHFCGLPNYNTCCDPPWECLSNGLCFASWDGGGYAQGSCTDPGFEKCLSFCDYAQPHNYAIVSRCEPAGNSWCFTCALQDPRSPSCCGSNLTTSLEPFPFTTVSLLQSRVDISSTTTSISFATELIPTPSSSLYRDTSLEPTSETSDRIPTQTSATPSGTLTSSPSTPPTSQRNTSKTNINVGIIAAVVVVLLAVLALFVFQNRKFKKHLLQLREGPSRRQGTRTAMQNGSGHPPGELDITHYELTQQNAPQHELSGNEPHELYHRGIPQHDLNQDDPQR